MVLVANKSFSESLQKIVCSKVEQWYWKTPTIKLLHKTFAIQLSTLKLFLNLTRIAKANLAFVQIPSSLHLPLNLFPHLSTPFNNFIDSSIYGTANLVDEADEAATTYNDKVAKLSALYIRWVYEDIKKKTWV